MIRIQLTDTLLPSIEGQCTLLTAPTISVPAVELDQFCLCSGCEYSELAFSESGSIVTDWKNDKTSMLFKKGLSSDTITIKLFKNDVETATISDNTYGTYTSTFTAQPLYVGFIADWNKIYNALGSGTYYFEITKVILGVTTVSYSIDYKCMLYSDLAANGTVRLETYNTGTILNSDFDYDGLVTGGYHQSYRVRGILMPKIPKIQVDNYLSQEYEVTQRQHRISNEWELVMNLLPASISNQIIYDNLLANKILISDFNIYSEESIKQKELMVADIPEKKVFVRNRNSKFVIKFTDKKLDGIKNNY